MTNLEQSIKEVLTFPFMKDVVEEKPKTARRKDTKREPEPKAETRREPRPAPTPRRDDRERELEPADEGGWNGPLPSFLTVSLN